MSTVIPLIRRTPAPDADPIDSVVESLAQALAATVVERDRRGGHAAAERELIRQSGLLSLTVPVQHGGQGRDWPTFYRSVRRLAEADSALAHLYAFHHLQLAGVQLYGTPQQQKRLFGATVAQHWFWGNALNPLDRRVSAVETEGGYRLQGIKSFSSGSVGSDWLTLSAWHEPTQTPLIGVLPTHTLGVTVQADWDAFGQKQTDSGNVLFEQVLLPHENVLQAPGTTPTPRSTLRSQVAQLILVNLYLGIGQGALHEALRYSRDEARPWFAAGVDAAVDDPYAQHRYAELWLLLRPAQVLADAAARQLDAAFQRGTDLSAAERGDVAIAVAEAKVLAHRAAIEVSSQLFELTGARSTSARYGFDRYWRNARVHTLHDPVDYKLRDIGRHLLTGAHPDATAYS